MKKATIIITIISILISVTSFIVIKLTDKKIEEISYAKERNNYIKNENKNLEASIEDSDNDHQYHYTDLNLNKKQYKEVNDCMQFFLKEENFNNANNCQEAIVDALIIENSERSLIKYLLGDMLTYSNNHVYIKYSYFRNLVLSGVRKSPLKDYLLLAFVNRYRDPIKLKQIYTDNKEYFYNYITKQVYRRVLKKSINSFISSHEEIHNKADKESFYKDIYFKADKQNKHGELWKYTFWKRRELEKNDQVIYSILKEVTENYSK